MFHTWMLSVIVVTCSLTVRAQVPVPFTSVDDRFMVFANKRFEKLEARPAKEVHAMDGQVVFVDHAGELKIFTPDGRTLHRLDGPGVSAIRSTRTNLAWTKADTLKVLRGGRAVVLSNGVARFTVTDSSVVYHDTLRHALMVARRGQVQQVASVSAGAEGPQWVHAGGHVALFEKATRRLLLFRDGEVSTLCDSTDVGIVAIGAGPVAFWDDRSDRFMVDVDGRMEVLSELRPVSAQAGPSMIAFVDGAGGLRCYANSKVERLTHVMPTAYWVQDSLLLFLEDGGLKLYDGISVTEVEPYVPERWQVEGGLLVYLDINRELRGWQRGERLRFGNEANIARFDLVGDAVVYPSPTGLITVLRNGRTYTF